MRKSCSAERGTCGPSRRRGAGSGAPDAPFFSATQSLLRPDRDQRLVALLGPCGGELHAEAVRLERPLQIARVVVRPELALDQGGNAREGSALSGKARRYCTSSQKPAQLGPGLIIEPGRVARNGAGLQAAPALLGQRGRPARDTGPAHPQLSGNLCLGEPPLP